MARAYRSLTHLRHLLIDHGVAVLIAEGTDRPLTLARVFDHIERSGAARVTKGSVLGPQRLWESQQAFRLDVEVEAVRRWGDSSMIDPRFATTTAEVLEASNLTTFPGRRLAFIELIRRVGEATLESNRRHPLWGIVVALWGRVSCSPTSPDVQRLSRALAQAHARMLAIGIEMVYRPLGAMIGLRGRDGLWSAEEGYRMTIFAASSLGMGMTLDQQFGHRDEPFLLPTGPGGALRSWSIYALATKGIVEEFLEVDPHWVTPAATERGSRGR